MKEVGDSYTQLLDNGVRMLLQLLTAWKNALTNTSGTGSGSGPGSGSSKRDPGVGDLHHLHLHQVRQWMYLSGGDFFFLGGGHLAHV